MPCSPRLAAGSIAVNLRLAAVAQLRTVEQCAFGSTESAATRFDSTGGRDEMAQVVDQSLDAARQLEPGPSAHREGPAARLAPSVHRSGISSLANRASVVSLELRENG